MSPKVIEGWDKTRVHSEGACAWNKNGQTYLLSGDIEILVIICGLLVLMILDLHQAPS